MVNPKDDVKENDTVEPAGQGRSHNVEFSKNDGVPRDHGFAWIILISATLEMALLIGILKSAGVLFVAFQEKFDSNSSMTSLVSTVQNIVFSISALFVMTIGLRLASCRILLFIGTIFVTIAYVITSQATDIRVLLISHGLLHGIGSAFMQPTTLTMLSQYFDKRRGFANSIAVSGGSLGGLIFAPLISYMLTVYGYQGCFLIIAGILLNACVSASLFRPTNFYTKRFKALITRNEMKSLISTDHQTENISEILGTTNCKNMCDDDISFNKLRVNGHAENLIGTTLQNTTEETRTRSNSANAYEMTRYRANRNQLNGDELVQLTDDSDFPSPRRRTRTYTDSSIKRVIDTLSHSSLSVHSGSEYMTGSVLEIPALLNKLELADIEEADESAHQERPKACFKTCSNMFDFKLFKLPVFITFMISAGCTCSGTVAATLFIAPHSRDIGVTVDDVARLVTIFSAVDLCSRILIGLISDKGWLRRSTIVAMSSLIVAISSYLVVFYRSFGTLVAFAVILGMVSGAYFSLYSVIIVDYMTLEKLPSCIGFTALTHGFSVAGTLYSVGYLRDVTKSYIIPYHVIGSLCLVGAIMMFLLPVVERLQHTGKR